ncbi:hypothetical protein [Domibacillus sp. PGB-M46]|nr:hypothetical protein [Domibacillus sp. PGB-M46]
MGWIGGVQAAPLSMGQAPKLYKANKAVFFRLKRENVYSVLLIGL